MQAPEVLGSACTGSAQAVCLCTAIMIARSSIATGLHAPLISTCLLHDMNHDDDDHDFGVNKKKEAKTTLEGRLGSSLSWSRCLCTVYSSLLESDSAPVASLYKPALTTIPTIIDRTACASRTATDRGAALRNCAKPSQAKPSQAKPSQAKPSHCAHTTSFHHSRHH